MADSLGYLRWDRMDGIWLTYVRERLDKTKQILKILIRDQNTERFMKYAAMEVRICL